jgi:hypothetical protein
MRRLLSLLLAATPALALPQSAGQLLFNANAEFTISKADCQGTGSVGLTWLAAEETAGVFASGTGQYDVYASPTDKTDAFPYCVLDDAYRLTGETIANPANLAGSASVSVAELVWRAGHDCTTSDETIYVCVVWKSDAGAVKAYAKGDVALKVAAPAPPTVTSVSPGENALNVRIAAATTGVEATEFRAKAEAIDLGQDAAIHYSPWDTDRSVRVEGLVNGVPYTVTAFSRSEEGNVSLESAAYVPGDPSEVTPIPILDGWEAYKEAGGQDSGGCQAGAGGLAALLGAAALLRLRRRS